MEPQPDEEEQDIGPQAARGEDLVNHAVEENRQAGERVGIAAGALRLVTEEERRIDAEVQAGEPPASDTGEGFDTGERVGKERA